MAKFATSLVLLALAFAAVDATGFGRGKFVTRVGGFKKAKVVQEKVVFYKPTKEVETTKVVPEVVAESPEEIVTPVVPLVPDAPAPGVVENVEVPEPAPVVEVVVPAPVVEVAPAPEVEVVVVPEPVVEVPDVPPSPEGVCPAGQFFVTKVEFSGCMDCDVNCAAECVDGVGCEVCKDGFFTFREDPVWPFECRSCDEFFPGCSACQQNVDLEVGPQPACLDG